MGLGRAGPAVHPGHRDGSVSGRGWVDGWIFFFGDLEGRERQGVLVGGGYEVFDVVCVCDVAWWGGCGKFGAWKLEGAARPDDRWPGN